MCGMLRDDAMNKKRSRRAARRSASRRGAVHTEARGVYQKTRTPNQKCCFIGFLALFLLLLPCKAFQNEQEGVSSGWGRLSQRRAQKKRGEGTKNALHSPPKQTLSKHTHSLSTSLSLYRRRTASRSGPCGTGAPTGPARARPSGIANSVARPDSGLYGSSTT